MKAAAGTSGSMKKINRKTLGSCLIPTPALNDQIKFLDKTKWLRDSFNSVIVARNLALDLEKAVIEALIGG